MIFINNKYTSIYYRIIDKALSRNIKSKKEANVVLGYTEVHHIIPKSIGGSNLKDNLVFLTGREHFLCHWLLVKMTTNKANEKMIFALNGMKRNSSKQNRYNTKITSRVYSKYKIVAAEIKRLKQTGIPQSASSNKKRSITQTGMLKGAFNKTLYTFYHYDGRVITCTPYDLYQQYGAQQGNLAKMIAGNKSVKCVNGWSLLKDNAGKKGHNQIGFKNPSYDKKIYTFLNRTTKTVEQLTQYELRMKYNLCKSNISAVCRGKQKSYKDWIIINQEAVHNQ
jgi:hypothetical protein